MVKLKADYVLTFNETDEIIKDGEILFDEKIIKVGHFDTQIPTYYLGKNSVLMPGLINTHVHLEFSANKTSLYYGDFIGWLNSVIDKREDLLLACKEECYRQAIDEMLQSGITAFGEISSTGTDLDAVANAPQKSVYFNEIIGSNPASVDVLYQDFLGRLGASKSRESEHFTSAVSIHSPYSVHPIVIDKVLEIAKKENMLVSAHFMESKTEREWLDNSKGEFKLFFESKLGQSAPITDSERFLDHFKDIKTHFIHAVHATEEELQKISSMGASIAHCPISNRLLNTGLLDLERIRNLSIPYSVATDGLSSNDSLNLFKELKSALLMQNELHPKYLAKDLLKSVTKHASSILNLNSGTIEVGKAADLISFTLPDEVESLDRLPLMIILHIKRAENVYIDGKEVLFSQKN